MIGQNSMSQTATAGVSPMAAAVQNGDLADLLVKKSIPIAEHHEQRVYRWWMFLVLVVCLMTVEWVMRKWVGLP